MIRESVYTLRAVAIITLCHTCGRVESASENAREFQVLATLFNGALNAAQSILHSSADKKEDPPKFNALSILDGLLTTTEDSDENHTKVGTTEWRKEFPHIANSPARQGLSNMLQRIKKRVEVLQRGFTEQESLRQRARSQAAKLFLEAAIGDTAAARLLPTIEKSGVASACTLAEGDVTASAGYDTICKGDGSSKPGQAIVFDFACICAKKNSGNADTYCGAGITGVDSGDTNNAATVATRAGVLCGKARGSAYKDARLDSPEALLAKVAEFNGLLGANVLILSPSGAAQTKDRPFILGWSTGHTSTAATCDGQEPTHSNARGVCVSYKDRFTKGEKIPWVDKLEQAAEKLQTAHEEKQKLLKIEHEMRTWVANAQAAYDKIALNTAEFTPQQIQTKAEKDLSKSNSMTANNPSLTAEHPSTSAAGFVICRGVALTSFLV